MTKKIRIRSKAKVVAKKTKVLIKKAKVKIGKTVKSLKKDWKSDKPRRENLEKELRAAASNMFRNGIQIGEDVVRVIKKDIKEINNK